jgi:hypothetical protein
MTRVKPLQIKLQVFHFREKLVPRFERLDIDGPKIAATLAQKARNQVPANKSSRTTNDDRFRMHNFFRFLSDSIWCAQMKSGAVA